VLPISNPANLVIYRSHMLPLLPWLQHYAMPSLPSITATYAVLGWRQRTTLQQTISTEITIPTLSTAGKLAAGAIITTAVDTSLGLPTFLAGLATRLLVLTCSR